MKKVSLAVLLISLGGAARAAETCPAGYIAVDMPDVEIADSCPVDWTSAGTINDCSSGDGVCYPAQKCEAGYYVKDDNCEICPESYYCEDGINRTLCPQIEGFSSGGTWNPARQDGFGCTKAEACCIVNVAPYTAPHGSGTQKCYYNSTGQTYDRSCHYHNLTKCDAGYYKDTSDTTYPTDCTPVGPGYYSAADATARFACPDGYTTRTETATSAAECEPLCGAGATEFHAGDLTFNMYPNDACESPAIRVGLDGGTCCVHLAPGAADGAINIEYEGEIYHTTN